LSVTFVAVGTEDASYTTGSAVPGIPPGLSTGDFMVAIATGKAGDNPASVPTVTAPAGWVLLGSALADVSGTPRDLAAYVWLKRYTAGETAGTFTFPSSFLGVFNRSWRIIIGGYTGIISPGLISNVETSASTTTTPYPFEPDGPVTRRRGTVFAVSAINGTPGPDFAIGGDNGFVRDFDVSDIGNGTAGIAIAHTTTEVDATTPSAAGQPTWDNGSTNASISFGFALASVSAAGLVRGRKIGPSTAGLYGGR
jgi:hypothetical protein